MRSRFSQGGDASFSHADTKIMRDAFRFASEALAATHYPSVETDAHLASIILFIYEARKRSGDACPPTASDLAEESLVSLMRAVGCVARPLGADLAHGNPNLPGHPIS